MTKRPPITTASITAILSAILGVVVVWVPLPDGAADAIQVLIGAASPMIVGVIAWRWASKQTPPASR